MTETILQKIDLLRLSINNLQQVSAVYNGYPRILCVHMLGTKEDQWKILCWQFGGSSSKPQELPTWRDFFVKDLHSVTSQYGDWHRGWTTGQHEQKAIDQIDTVVAATHAAEILDIFPPRTVTPKKRR